MDATTGKSKAELLSLDPNNIGEGNPPGTPLPGTKTLLLGAPGSGKTTSLVTLIEAEPLAGRRHQIRYHLKHKRHYIVGDTTYGQGKINKFFREDLGLTRMFLHASRLEIEHPRTSQPIKLTADLPPEFLP